MAELTPDPLVPPVEAADHPGTAKTCDTSINVTANNMRSDGSIRVHLMRLPLQFINEDV